MSVTEIIDLHVTENNPDMVGDFIDEWMVETDEERRTIIARCYRQLQRVGDFSVHLRHDENGITAMSIWGRKLVDELAGFGAVQHQMVAGTGN